MNRIQAILKIMTNSLTRKGLLAAILLATGLLTAGYLLGQLWLEVPVVFLLGLLWAVCVLRDMHWVASPLFILMLGSAALGYLARLSPILMLAAGCASVIAWDLHQLEARLLDLDEPGTRDMEKQHLLRSLGVISASFLVIAAASLVRIRIQFIYLIAITVLAILILNQVMLRVRKAGRPAPPKE
jgi:hypothetical protein